MRDSDGSDAPPPHQARARPGDAALGRALALVRHLRERCPWDARQDPRSLRPYLLEEAHEVAEAIQAGDDGALPEELGDLLLNVAFQVVLAEEREAFGAPEVVERLEGKMAARHPHIYGDAEAPPDWEWLKARERAERAARAEEAAGGDAEGPGADRRAEEGAEREGADGERGTAPPDPFAGVPEGLEPLSRALRLQDRAAALGFDWPDPRGPVEKLREEAAELLEALDAGAVELPTAREEAELPEAGGTGEVARPGEGHPREARPREGGRREARIEEERRRTARIEEEVGDLLFAAVNAARLLGVHPSNALLSASDKFRRRFRAIRRLARERGLAWEGASLEELDALWEAAKRREGDGEAGE